MTPDDELIEDIASFTHDPEGFALYAYEWGMGELTGVDGPRAWQRDVMRDIAEHLQCEATRHMPLMLAVASGHGIGKSALISMLADWGMSTCEDCKVVVTANTDTQLRTKTWPEISKWFRLAINRSWFNVTATSIATTDTGHMKSWRADAVPWSEHNTEAFAGLHNKGKRIILIFDEASNIADKVWEVAEGALTDEDTEIIWIAFGNPTRNTGRFKQCFTKFRHRWKCRQIDSRTVEGTNKAQIQKWIEDHGEDSDFVKVRVRGMFPSSSSRQFIGTDIADAAFGRSIVSHQYDFAPVIITCDPAWSGDDKLEIAMRQGNYFKILRTIPKNDNDVMIANIIANYETELKADAVFVDGGYGTGIVSAGQTMGRSWELVWFGSSSPDNGYLNLRAYMIGMVKKWLQEGGCIEKDQELYDDIISPETVPRLDGKIQIESKESMKARGLPSPNKLDALALSFARPVFKRDPQRSSVNKRREYDSF